MVTAPEIKDTKINRKGKSIGHVLEGFCTAVYKALFTIIMMYV
ncbi:MAG TPA: hypothetical protein VIY08_07220 [Candidatus Nitrosocosmicus sp.]